MKRASIIIALLIMALPPIFGQGTPIPQLFSPDAAEIGKYGKIPVSYFTGVPAISIPLTEVKGKNITVPVYLTYHAGGNKPEQHPGWVGEGWTLHAGGCINRIINGEKDELSYTEFKSNYPETAITFQPGYFDNMESVSSTDWSAQTELDNSFDPYRPIDRMPDEFQVNLDDIKASFFFVGENDIRIVSQTDSDFKVECHINDGELALSNGPNEYGGSLPMYRDASDTSITFKAHLYRYIDKITIISKDGKKYTFGGDRSAIEFSIRQRYSKENAQLHPSLHKWNAVGTANTWMLTKIEMPDGEEISFTYAHGGIPIIRSVSNEVFKFNEVVGTNQNNKVNYVLIDTFTGVSNGSIRPYLGTAYHFLMPSYLTRITSSRTGDYLAFESSVSNELEYPFINQEIDYLVGTFNEPTKPFPPEYLKSHSYYKKLSIIHGRREMLSFGYVNMSSERLRLGSVSIKDGSATIGSYAFEYNSIALPAYNARMSDIFGYYNGYQQPASHADTINVNYNSLRVNPILLQAGILTRITYPTGGFTSFEYEPHTYGKIVTQFPFSIIPSSGIVGGLRIKSITDSTGSKHSTRQFFYIDEQGNNSGILSGLPRCSVSGTLKRTAQGPFLQPVTVYDDYSIYQDASITPLSLSNGCHMTYSNVKEVLENGSYIFYQYSNHDSSAYRDSASVSIAGTITGRMIGDSYMSKELCRGLLLSKKEYSSSGTLLKVETNTYRIDYEEYINSVSRMTLCGTHEPFFRSNYNRIYCYYPYLSSSTSTSYMDNGFPIKSTDTYDYDSYRNLISKSRVVGDQSYQVQTSFSGTMGWGNYKVYLIPKGMTGLPVETRTLINGKIIAAEIIDYDYRGLESSHYTAEISTPLTSFTNYAGIPASRDTHYSSSPDWRVQSRDSFGNPVKVYNQKGGYLTFLWEPDGNNICMKSHGNKSIYLYDFENNSSSPEGFNSNHCHVGPFVLNCQIDSGVEYYCDYWINNGIGWKYYKSRYEGGNKVLSTLPGVLIDHVRVYPALAEVQSFTWYSNGNLRSDIDARGKVHVYEYDGLGRLIKVRDSDGCIKEDYDYKLITGNAQNNRRIHKVYIEGSTDGSSPFLSEIEYYDGLGYNTQNVKRSTTMSSIVTLLEYDSAGRLSNSWLPIGTGMNGYTEYGRDGIKNQGASVYQYADTVLYRTTVYDSTPDDRVREEWLPGEEWRNNGKKKTYSYNANQSSGVLACRKYEVLPQSDTLWNIHFVGYHVSGTLLVKQTTDEDGICHYEFRDCLDRIILSRVINGSDCLDTYYVYDGMGRLQAVFPPSLMNFINNNIPQIASPSGGASDILNQYAYLYQYDSRGNCIGKKMPGCGWTYMVYDKRNQLVLIQNAEQRKTDSWSYTLTDDLGRIVIKGSTSGTLSVSSDPLKNVEVKAERSSSEAGIYGYVMRNFPFNFHIEYEVNWYDDYSFRGLWDVPSADDLLIQRTVGIGDGSSTPEPTGASSLGLLTGRLEYVIGKRLSNSIIWSVWYYDKIGRVVQYNRERIDGGADKEEYTYSFTDDLTSRTIIHDIGAVNQMTESYSYSYDTWFRPSSVKHQLGGLPQVTLHQWSYDNVGRLKSDRRNGSLALNTLYESTIHGKRSEIMTGPQGQTFFEKLHYQKVPSDGPYNSPLWNGRISRLDWRAGLDSMTRSYVFGYDDASRLTSAEYSASSGGSDYSRFYSYDMNGNVISISGTNRSSSQTTGEQISLFFDHSGNQINQPLGNYDNSGRMTQNFANGSSINYNDYDKPASVHLHDTLSYYYAYTLEGRKVETGLIKRRHILHMPVVHYYPHKRYEGNAQYSFLNDSTTVLDMLLVDGGYIDVSDSTYHFFVLDHLGSVRVVADANGNVEQVNHYGPYGDMLQDGVASLPSGPDNNVLNPYKYIGKEWDERLLSYDFGARYYNPSIARWMIQDPNAEDYYPLSPYSYCAGDPINIVDDDGLHTRVIDNGNGTYTVIGGELDDDLNVYVYTQDIHGNYTVRGESIGRTMFNTSFYSTDTSEWVKDAIIDISDVSGQEFLNQIINATPNLFYYMYHARNGYRYDFKVTNGTDHIVSKSYKYQYRGMKTFNSIVSARDVGNLSAGFVAGVNGLPYIVSRFGFDSYETYSQLKKSGHFVFTREGLTTRNAEFHGWLWGSYIRSKRIPL